MDTDLIGYQAWLEETRDDPLESMSGFFDNRVEDYEAHMARWERHYLWMAQLLPAGQTVCWISGVEPVWRLGRFSLVFRIFKLQVLTFPQKCWKRCASSIQCET